jgi:hypothetical protein
MSFKYTFLPWSRLSSPFALDTLGLSLVSIFWAFYSLGLSIQGKSQNVKSQNWPPFLENSNKCPFFYLWFNSSKLPSAFRATVDQKPFFFFSKKRGIQFEGVITITKIHYNLYSSLASVCNHFFFFFFFLAPTRHGFTKIFRVLINCCRFCLSVHPISTNPFFLSLSVAFEVLVLVF